MLTKFATKQEFYSFWDASDHKKHNSLDFVVYFITKNMLKFRIADESSRKNYWEAFMTKLTKDLLEAFPPVINSTKLANGRKPYDSLLADLDFIYQSLSSVAYDLKFSRPVRPYYKDQNFLNTFRGTLNVEKIDETVMTILHDLSMSISVKRRAMEKENNTVRPSTENSSEPMFA